MVASSCGRTLHGRRLVRQQFGQLLVNLRFGAVCSTLASIRMFKPQLALVGAPGRHGKEGVNGSSPFEGSAKSPLTGILRSARLADVRAGLCGVTHERAMRLSVLGLRKSTLLLAKIRSGGFCPPRPTHTSVNSRLRYRIAMTACLEARPRHVRSHYFGERTATVRFAPLILLEGTLRRRRQSRPCPSRPTAHPHPQEFIVAAFNLYYGCLKSARAGGQV